MKVIFKVKTLDKDTRIEYPASNVEVEVSDAFAKRLANDPRNKNGKFWEIEGVEYSSKEDANDDKASKTAGEANDIKALRDKYFALSGSKAGNMGEARLLEEIASLEASQKSETDEPGSGEDKNSVE